ncbi:MAG: L,D-transpeptidase [Candidatus Competibacter sp.]
MGWDSGNPGIHNAGIDWTSGCVALDNRQIDALRPWIKVGMRVEIR